MANPIQALELIKEIGITRLCDFDDCVCGYFSVKGVKIDIYCRKGSDLRQKPPSITLRVYTKHLNNNPEMIKSISLEVASQIQNIDSGYPIEIRYCAWKFDHRNQCCYCGNPRENIRSYLCPKCEHRPKMDIADRNHLSFIHSPSPFWFYPKHLIIYPKKEEQRV